MFGHGLQRRRRHAEQARILRLGDEALALRQSMATTTTTLRWCHSHAQLADMMTKYNASTVETWRFFHERQSWKLVYDPDFVSAKKRAQKGLTILDDQNVKAENGDDFEFDVADDNDAWLCIGSELAHWRTTLEESDPKIDMFYNGDIVPAMRRA